MKKVLLSAGLAAGIMMQACSSHNSGLVPTTPAVPNGAEQASPAQAGTRTLPVAAAPSGFDVTATNKLSPAKATDTGKAASNNAITVRVGLRLRNEQELHALIASHQIITLSDFTARFAPLPGAVQKVVAYLHAQGFSNVQVEPNNLLISATGKVSQAESAFRTQLHSFAKGGKSLYANVAPAYVPKTLDGVVLAVLGLNNLAVATPALHIRRLSMAPNAAAPQATPSPSPCSLYGLEIIGFPTGPEPEPYPQAGCLRNYYPADFWRAYDVGKVPAAKSKSIGIMVEGSVTAAISNLRVNEQHDGLPQVPVSVVQIGAPSTDTSGDDEWTLDMVASSGMAGNVSNITLYDVTSLTDSDIALGYSRWATKNTAAVLNSSFGICEAFPYLDGTMAVDDELFNEAAAQGQTAFASSGDTGAYCPVVLGENGVPAGAPMVNYPAASPYDVAVGGTTLITEVGGTYQGETAWYSGGGGLSQFEYAPSWEASAQPVASEGESFRGVPDVAMDGDLQTGMNLYLADQSGWTVIGGTSLSSPLAVGVWARVEQVAGKRIYAPPALYANYANTKAGSPQAVVPPTEAHGAFHDLLAGCNGSIYCALPGYDYTTGLGSFDVTLATQQI